MTNLFVDSYQGYATGDLLKKYNSAFGTAGTNYIISSGNGPRGGACLRLTTGSITKNLPSTYTTLVIGTRFRQNSSFIASQSVIWFRESTTVHVDIFVNGSGQIVARRNGTTLATSTNALTLGQYDFIEVKATISDTVGAVIVRVNGTEWINVSSVDTKNGGTGVIDNYQFSSANSSGTTQTNDFADTYVNSTAGSANNDFASGDVRIDYEAVTSDGNYTNFTPDTGSTHYTQVDDPLSPDPSTTIQTTVSGGTLSNSNTTVTTPSSGTASFPSTGTIQIETELITYTGTTSTTFTGCTRGAFGTTAASHANGVAIQFASFVQSANVNDIDTYGVDNLATSSGTIYAIQICAALVKDDAGAKSAATVCRSSSTDSVGTSTAISTSMSYLCQVFETDPNTGVAWTDSGFNAAEIGIKVTA